jgi:CRISPR-associated endonuclease Cas1
MQVENTLPVKPLSASRGVVVVDGHDAKLYVRSGQLQIEDIRAGIRRRGTFPRATSKLVRVIVVGSEGFVTLEAIRWLAGISASFVHLGRDGRLFASSADYGLDDSRLRRAQALARENGIGVRLAQAILAHKLRGQASVLSSFRATTGKARITAELERLLAPRATLESIRLAESKAAAAYWKAWEKLPVRFAKAEAGKVPMHWLSFGLRHSPLTASPRLAANPANAILNYLYAIAEVECRIACFAVGLDPSLGIVHADQRARDSMALDLIEAVRPSVDALALELFRSRTFARRDFFELPSGSVRIKVSLARALTGTCLVWRQHAAPVAEEAARILASESSSIDILPTPLTQGNRSKGRDGIRKGERKLRLQASVFPRACVSCGVVFDDRRERTYCDDCVLDVRRSEFDRARDKATGALDALRRQGSDPAHGGDAATKRATSLARRRAQAEAFERMAGELPPRETFTRDILPGLASASIRAMAEATGLTRAYCSMIRRGVYVPHPRHWEALRKLSTGRERSGSPQLR